jgi:hypothetical protein
MGTVETMGLGLGIDSGRKQNSWKTKANALDSNQDKWIHIERVCGQRYLEKDDFFFFFRLLCQVGQ